MCFLHFTNYRKFEAMFLLKYFIREFKLFMDKRIFLTQIIIKI